MHLCHAADRVWTLFLCLDEYQLVTEQVEAMGLPSSPPPASKDLIHSLACVCSGNSPSMQPLEQELNMNLLPVLAGELTLQ